MGQAAPPGVFGDQRVELLSHGTCSLNSKVYSFISSMASRGLTWDFWSTSLYLLCYACAT